MYHIFLIHSSMNGHLRFYVLTIVIHIFFFQSFNTHQSCCFLYLEIFFKLLDTSTFQNPWSSYSVLSVSLTEVDFSQLWDHLFGFHWPHCISFLSPFLISSYHYWDFVQLNTETPLPSTLSLDNVIDYHGFSCYLYFDRYESIFIEGISLMPIMFT